MSNRSDLYDSWQPPAMILSYFSAYCMLLKNSIVAIYFSSERFCKGIFYITDCSSLQFITASMLIGLGTTFTIMRIILDWVWSSLTIWYKRGNDLIGSSNRYSNLSLTKNYFLPCLTSVKFWDKSSFLFSLYSVKDKWGWSFSTFYDFLV